MGGEIRRVLALGATAALLVHAWGCPGADNSVELPPPPTTNTGGEGGMGGDGGAGGEGGFFDDGCEEQPCKLVPIQCGCPVGQRCVHVMADRRCIPVGGTPRGAACDNDCQQGSICISNGTGAPRVCHRYCAADADCPGDGAACAIALPGMDEGLCTESCDPIGQTGCAVQGTKCDIGVSGSAFSQCTGAGAAAQGEACATSPDCAAGLTCTSVNAGPNTCYTWCDVAAPLCPGQTSCTGFSPAVSIGSVEYGVCI